MSNTVVICQSVYDGANRAHVVLLRTVGDKKKGGTKATHLEDHDVWIYFPVDYELFVPYNGDIRQWNTSV